MKIHIGGESEGYETAVFDQFSFPWDAADGLTEDLLISNTLERLPHHHPDYGVVDGWWLFWDEVYRICKPDAKVFVRVSYAKSDRAYANPEYVRVITDQTFYWLSSTFREREKIEAPHCHHNFETIVVHGGGVDQKIALRSNEAQEFSNRHYWNVVEEINVELKRLKEV